MNKTILMGNLGQDPELKYTQAGTAVMQLRLATNERRKTPNGEWGDHTEWHSVVVWDKRAEGLSKVLTKGSRVLVEGVLRTSSWEKDGEKRYRTEIVARDVELCGGAKKQQQQAAPAEAPQDDDIPF